MTLRWGIVTAENSSNDFVNALNSYPATGDQEIVAIADRDKRAAEFAKIHNITKVFHNYEGLARSSDIDVAYIRKWSPEHYVVIKCFLENGKHVLYENFKPFCLNAKQTQTLINLAREKNLFLMEAVWTRFSPSYIYLEEEIAAGSLGEIRSVEANFGIFCESARVLKEDHFFVRSSAVLDIGIYLMQLSQYIFKEEPTTVIAVDKRNVSGVDDTESIILEYGGGKRAVLNSLSRLELLNRATIYGTKGHITLEDPFHFPNEVTAIDGTLKTFPLSTSNHQFVHGNSAGIAYQAVEVARCIRAGLVESPRMSHKESLILAKLIDTVRYQLGIIYDEDFIEFPYCNAYAYGWTPQSYFQNINVKRR